MSQFREQQPIHQVRVNLSPPARPAPRPRPMFWLFLFGVVLPLCVLRIPGEVSGWYLASALRERDAKNHEAAYRKLDQADYWIPNSPTLLLQRAEWKLEDGQREEALADCEKMLKAAKGEVGWVIIHAAFLQHAGDFSAAVEDWKKLDRFSQRSGNPDRASALNGTAYAMALAKADLDDALKMVNEALELVPNEANILDTRGYIYFAKGDYDAALVDLNKAMPVLDDEVAAATILAKKHSMPAIFRKTTKRLPKGFLESPLFDRSGDAEAIRTSRAQAAAVVHYHRSLVLDALGRKGEAAKDRAMVKVLIGREPDESLF